MLQAHSARYLNVRVSTAVSSTLRVTENNSFTLIPLLGFYENFHTIRTYSPHVWFFCVCAIFKYHLVFIRYGSGVSATTLFYRGT
ncbi:MAG TPA: hypothetical protein VJB66_05265, partial [Candidatus Nanoarchaeia archaeon]|nr:hypothetical protein [Candidatus Nanoarchaeia archaeon]